ncbi:tetratricopeptide repeat protein [Geopsychrobacter electrodiphilus]|uniref:tetratricopeptide repeat protein n=1 Tax=Geopsychrobacter electrodiphilus TaxID=225196 RepID=UPI0003690CCD|nr:tetratricopeptide repeat protein [Geopsychrobacter electrodiphilus]
MKSLFPLCVLVLLLGSVLSCAAAPSLVDHYLKALDADPQNPSLRYHLGVALLSQGEDQKALSAFRAVYSQRISDPEINYNLALVYSRLKDPDSALIYLDQSAATGAAEQPEVYPLQNVYSNLVLLYEKQGRLDAAADLLKRLVQENPSSLHYLRMLGDYQAQLGRIDEAVITLRRYLKQVPDDSETRAYIFAVLFNRGLLAYGRQDFPSARAEFERARTFDPDSTPVSYYLILLDYQEGQFERVAERLPLIYPDLTNSQQESARSMLFNTALSLKKKDHFESAQKALEPLSLATHPRAKDLALLAGLQLQMGKFLLARQSYLRVLSLDPTFTAAAEGVQAADKGAFEEILNTAADAFTANDLPVVQQALDQAAKIFPHNNRLRIYQARLAKASSESWKILQRKAAELEVSQKYTEALALVRQGLILAPGEVILLRHEKRLVDLLADRVQELLSQGKSLYLQGDMHGARTRFAELGLLTPGHLATKRFSEKIDQELHQQAERAVGAGEKALARAEFIEAQSLFEVALAAWPTEVAAQSGLKQVKKKLAQQDAEILFKARRARQDGKLLVARELLKKGRHEGAETAIEVELSQVESELTAKRMTFVSLVEAALDKLQFGKASQLLAQSALLGDRSDFADLETEFANARSAEIVRQLTLARKKAAATDFEQGIKAYRRVLDLEPNNAEALAGLINGREALSATISQILKEAGRSHQAGHYDQAARDYRRVLVLDSHQPSALKGLKMLERANRAGLTADDRNRLYLHGIELYTEGNYGGAIDAWTQLLDLEPANQKARMNIDKAERKLQQIKEREGG